MVFIKVGHDNYILVFEADNAIKLQVGDVHVILLSLESMLPSVLFE